MWGQCIDLPLDSVPLSIQHPARQLWPMSSLFFLVVYYLHLCYRPHVRYQGMANSKSIFTTIKLINLSTIQVDSVIVLKYFRIQKWLWRLLRRLSCWQTSFGVTTRRRNDVGHCVTSKTLSRRFSDLCDKETIWTLPSSCGGEMCGGQCHCHCQCHLVLDL